MTKQKILVIGLDGATFKILDKLHKENKTPFLSSLRNKSYGILESTIPSISAPAWASFQTGVNPGKHSIYDFFYQSEDSKKIINSQNIKSEKVWEYLGKEGHKSLLINMPISYPVTPINGVMISSFLTPKNSSYLYPVEYKNELDKIDYEVDLFLGGESAFPSKEVLSKKEKEAILSKLIKIAKKRVKVLKKLAFKENFSFYFIYFKGLDIIQHLDFDGILAAKYYRAVDHLAKDVENFISKSTRNLTTFVISDHGFHKSPKYEVFLDYWFRKEFKFAREKNNKNIWNAFHLANNCFKKFGFSATRIPIFKKLRRGIIDNINEKKVHLTGKAYNVDVKGIYLGDEYSDEEKETILATARLLELEGERVFSEVHFRENIYSGKFLGMAPDIVWVTNEKFVVNPIRTAISIVGKHETNLKGEHYSDREGVFFLKGKNLKKIKGKYSIQDLLPTFLYILGIDIPDTIDGHVMDVFVQNDKKENQKIKITAYKRLENMLAKQFINVRDKS